MQFKVKNYLFMLTNLYSLLQTIASNYDLIQYQVAYILGNINLFYLNKEITF